ncbi:MAG: ComEC/Rec2 family competence protein [Patescibacteria group bacterium]|nr:MBL fold metallo-hydrolase [Patescibacteria group bacterium]MBU0879586.1 MBL fold metallo-hydrolase [Patescibacteria group bacterium]MBU0880287.1 MBL fold metallo-hydrolase [Patescibacteria group bacterium]MBU1062891.1 MBL fold metallo-hydrolase [Patescibacteria group bacterium]MBU1783681.1 MBL fold metallo-hydrolase [Patescibacteria group bacterium]
MIFKSYKILLIFIIVLILLFLGFFWFFYRSNNQLEVDFLDVGQGDSILIKSPAGQNILIDGGPDQKIIKRLRENLSWWDKQIDLMILTHPHDDHVSGLINVLKRYDVKEIVYSGVVCNSPNYLAWLKLVQEKKIKLTIIDRPQTVKLSDNCQLEMIYPQKSLLGQEVENLNNSSIVIRLVYGKTKFLFVGDLEELSEKELLNSEVDLTADVLKVGHHGSDTSSSQLFLEKIKPRLAIISVGLKNDFGHPSLRIIKRLERLGIKVLRTDQLGTIKLISN